MQDWLWQADAEDILFVFYALTGLVRIWKNAAKLNIKFGRSKIKFIKPCQVNWMYRSYLSQFTNKLLYWISEHCKTGAFDQYCDFCRLGNSCVRFDGCIKGVRFQRLFVTWHLCRNQLTGAILTHWNLLWWTFENKNLSFIRCIYSPLNW